MARYNFVFILIALVSLYLAFNAEYIIQSIGLPELGVLSIFFKIFFFILSALSLMKMVGA